MGIKLKEVVTHFRLATAKAMYAEKTYRELPEG